jgi:hypothetical protein
VGSVGDVGALHGAERAQRRRGAHTENQVTGPIWPPAGSCPPVFTCCGVGRRAMYRGVLDTRELRERAEKLADKEQDIIKWQATVALEGLQSLHGRRLGDRVDVPGAGLQPEAWVRKEVEALQSFDSAWVEDMIEDADEGWGAGGASGTRLASAASGEVMDWWGDVGGGFHQGGTHGAHWARLLDSVGEER